MCLVLDVFILGKENRFPELENCKAGSTVSTNENDYPSFDELLAKHEEIQNAALDHLATLSDEDLDQKSNGPPEFEQYFGTVGACFAAMASHMAFHNGQVADARRAAGREPLMG